MSGISLRGADKLAKKLESMGKLEAVKNIVKTDGARLQNYMQREAANNFGKINPRTGKRYSTGQTRRSIMAPTITNGGLTATVKPTTEYSPYVEYGTRYMEAEPFVRPAWTKAKAEFERHLKALV